MQRNARENKLYITQVIYNYNYYIIYIQLQIQ
nr:MAG TPA: hypothetical protein [Caudoviricetes sp.]